MAQRRYTVAFYAAMIIAAMATYGVYRVLEAAKATNRVLTRAVVVAAKDIPDGMQIDAQALVVKPFPAVAVPAGAYARIEDVAGRIARIPIFTGEAMLPGRLAPPGVGPGLEARITPGMRAMSVRINDVAGLSGLIQPNSRVDVLVTLKESNSPHAQEVSKVFLENMRVLSVGNRVNRDARNEPIAATSATLEVTPVQAERLAVAVREGMVQLVLRGFNDPDSGRTKGVTTSEVLAQLREAKPVELAPAPKPVAAAPKKRVEKPLDPKPLPVAVAPPKPDSLTVRVYRGGQVTQQKFEKDTSRTP